VRQANSEPQFGTYDGHGSNTEPDRASVLQANSKPRFGTCDGHGLNTPGRIPSRTGAPSFRACGGLANGEKGRYIPSLHPTTLCGVAVDSRF
jgi:hypothetical protein